MKATSSRKMMTCSMKGGAFYPSNGLLRNYRIGGNLKCERIPVPLKRIHTTTISGSVMQLPVRHGCCVHDNTGITTDKLGQYGKQMLTRNGATPSFT